MPPWPASSMDGYALRSADTSSAAAAAPARLTVAGRVPAGGMAERPIPPREALPIFTRAPPPEAAHSIIPPEGVRTEGPTPLGPPPVREGGFRRPRGEGLRPGDPA